MDEITITEPVLLTETNPEVTGDYPVALEQQPVKKNDITLFQGISEVAFEKEIQEKLLAPIAEDDVEIRPDGLIYYPEILYRKRLNEAFGAGAWALMPRGDKFIVQGNSMMRPFAMYIHGRFISETIGEGEYIPSNSQMTYASVAEGVKSNALMRCCKDLGIASELWQPKYINEWKKNHAVQVWVEGKNKPQWRRTDREPFYKESGVVTGNVLPADNQMAMAKEILGALPKPTVTTNAPVKTTDGGRLCAVCGKEMKQIPAGVSKTTGKPYNSFFACSNKCKQPR